MAQGVHNQIATEFENDEIDSSNVQEFVDHYRQDIPNIAGLDAELILWERMWKSWVGNVTSSHYIAPSSVLTF